ncbi:MAG: methyltransferase domain-containing protein [Lachnospiraceae bacterium]
MEAYSGFAQVYDRFMDNVPYEEWGEWLVRKLNHRGIVNGLVLDLACGTGKLTQILAENGYDMTGIDRSEEMLAIAQNQRDSQGILYLCQDMCEFELYGTVKAIVSVCDSVNYILELEDLTKMFRLVNNYLDPGGLFVFDMNTEYKYRNLLGDRSFSENREDCSFIWDNFYDEQERLNQYDLTLFVQEEGALFRRLEETHLQRAYSLDEITQAVTDSGLILEEIYSGYSDEAITEESERYVFFLRENGKEK